jgi:hypothetical protein
MAAMLMDREQPDDQKRIEQAQRQTLGHMLDDRSAQLDRLDRMVKPGADGEQPEGWAPDLFREANRASMAPSQLARIVRRVKYTALLDIEDAERGLQE